MVLFGENTEIEGIREEIAEEGGEGEREKEGEREGEEEAIQQGSDKRRDTYEELCSCLHVSSVDDTSVTLSYVCM